MYVLFLIFINMYLQPILYNVFVYHLNSFFTQMILKYKLTGMLDIFVIGSIFSTQPIDTSGIQSAQDTWAHFCPLRVLFIAPP